MRRNKTIFLLTVLFALTAASTGCQKKKRNNRGSDDALPATDGADGNPDGAAEGGDGKDGPAKEGGVDKEPAGLSTKGRVRFKKQQLIENDIAKALTLDKSEICNELGELKCIDEVHYLALGGVDAYEKSIYTGIQQSSSTTPVVIERIALTACGKRADADFANSGSAVIFQGLTTDASGKLATPAGAEVKHAVDTLYKRILKRAPSSTETSDLISMYSEIAGTGTEGAAKKWAQLSCYTLLTSIEFIFY